MPPGLPPPARRIYVYSKALRWTLLLIGSLSVAALVAAAILTARGDDGIVYLALAAVLVPVGVALLLAEDVCLYWKRRADMAEEQLTRLDVRRRFDRR